MDFQWFIEVLSTYRFFPDWVLWLAAIGITSLEWVLALWFLSGWRIENGALIALILYGLYANGPPNCGCYACSSRNRFDGIHRLKTWCGWHVLCRMAVCEKSRETH